MTREEAKAWFKVLLKDEYAFNSADREAFAMAIKALEQEPCDVFDEYGNYKYPSDVKLTEPNTATSMPCEDAISREDALMCLTGEWTEITDEIIHRFIKRIKALPPVNPQPCEDAISRQAVLEYIELSDAELGHSSENKSVCQDIKEFPPVTPAAYIAKVAFDKDELQKIVDEKVKELTLTQGWIPVSERLPKIADVYRVTRYFPNNVMNPQYLVDACFFNGSNTWYNDNRINHERNYANNVIAWQENPEPYEPQESEDKG